MRRLLVGCCAAAVFFALFVSSAGAVDIIEGQEPDGVVESTEAGWQAGLCSADENAAGEPCSSKTPELFFEQAAGHPPDGVTDFSVGVENEDQVGRVPDHDRVGLFRLPPLGRAYRALHRLRRIGPRRLHG